ncbi:phasin family protein [Lichenifustis flavocetrariae]|uniref:Phasin family protein n=1 Tax=Lichenifustis flavocetrariae TaxID=2949735 RepID=A0AA42CKR1_9HYPH|nr:phasin family protein [Lichenifustis flavocetrariae]MCW6509541.1 phasin family protein [Lichenifustis flavocetrariae]
MMVDNDRPGEGEGDAHPAEEHAAQTSEAVSEAGSEIASHMMDVTKAVAEETEAANSQTTEILKAASQDTSEAVDAARQHLNAMWSSLPGGNQGALGSLKTAAESLGKGAEANSTTTLERMAEFNSKAIAAWRVNAEAAIQHWRNLASVKTLSEAISLNAEHARRQMDAVRAQTTELSTLATRIVREAADPMKFSGR